MKQLRLIIAGRMGFIGRPVVRFYRGTITKQKLGDYFSEFHSWKKIKNCFSLYHE